MNLNRPHNITTAIRNILCGSLATLITASLSWSVVTSTAGLKWMGSSTLDPAMTMIVTTPGRVLFNEALCEYVQHLAIYDYVALNPSITDRYCEYVDHLHEHFVEPVRVVGARYQAPLAPGYSIEMKQASLAAHEYPGGSVWSS